MRSKNGSSDGERAGRGFPREGLSIFWRLALGSLAIIVVMAGVDVYALIQLRQLTSLNTRLMADHYPTIGGARRLLASLFAQHRSEQNYFAVHDKAFLADFDEEAEEFRRTLAVMLTQDPSATTRGLLDEAGRLHREYRERFRGESAHLTRFRPLPAPDYVASRDGLIARLTNTLQRYIHQHEADAANLIEETRASALDAERVTRWLVILAAALGLGLAGAGSYSILRPLHRVRDHIRAIGHGAFGGIVQVEAPRDLRDLVDTVNWMGGKLQELDDMKRDFLTNVSHELRTPLASIHEGTHLLLDEIPGSLTAEQREALQIMADSSQRLIQLITNLLDFSKMEAGMMEYRIIPTDVKRVVEVSVKKVRLLAERRRIPIRSQSPPGRIWVHADAARIEQVLDNLLSNALKFSPEGAPVEVRIELDSAAGHALVSVSDSGPGIAPEDLPCVFDRFYQGRRAPNKPAAGSGLGLALAKRVVEVHGGRIWAESRPGHGAAVRFLLPLAQPRRAP